MTAPQLETNRLLLRQVSLADAPAAQTHFANWNVIKNIGGIPWPYPEDGARTYIERRLKDVMSKEIYFWGLFLKSAPEALIGTIEYRFFEEAEDNRGFWLSEAHWGKGLMTEAVCATQDYVFFELKKQRLLIRSLCSNTASRVVKEKTGARLIGKGTSVYHNGEQDEDIWEVTPETWATARSRLR